MAANTSTMLANESAVPNQPGPLSDGNSSSLSELDDMPDDQPDFDMASEQGSDQDEGSVKDNDTEAETERIDPSPAKLRQDAPAQPAEEEDEEDDEEQDEGESPPQPQRDSSIVAPEVEPLSPVPMTDNVQDQDVPMADAVDDDVVAEPESPRKRKRSSSLSDIDEASDMGEHPVQRRSTSKRLDTSASPTREDGEPEADGAVQDEEPSEDEQEVPAEEEVPEDPAPLRKRTRRTAQEEEAAATPIENAEDGEGAENEEDEDANGPTGDQDDDNTARSEEEREFSGKAEPRIHLTRSVVAKKMAAMDNFKQIESKWAIFRDQ